MHDYIEYALEKYYKELEQEEEMERLGFKTVDEYYDYLADLQAALEDDKANEAYKSEMEAYISRMGY